MTRALEETNRRREKQRDWNRINGITPVTIEKEVYEIIDGLHLEARTENTKLRTSRAPLMDEKTPNIAPRSATDLSKALTD